MPYYNFEALYSGFKTFYTIRNGTCTDRTLYVVSDHVTLSSAFGVRMLIVYGI